VDLVPHDRRWWKMRSRTKPGEKQQKLMWAIWNVSIHANVSRWASSTRTRCMDEEDAM
jgi:hypothetical protein